MWAEVHGYRLDRAREGGERPGSGAISIKLDQSFDSPLTKRRMGKRLCLFGIHSGKKQVTMFLYYFSSMMTVDNASSPSHHRALSVILDEHARPRYLG